ncbi:MAG: 4Fe-4S binding protein, partial [Desulfobacteraceae bacterium]|nr:4Fe-4S binding protein [Desulfobacteraceae bacterium]
NILLKPNILVGDKPEKCVQCGICVNICPVKPKALFFKDDDKSVSPIYNYDDCIKCLCCQEICPESAIELKTPVLRKIINLF